MINWLALDASCLKLSPPVGTRQRLALLPHQQLMTDAAFSAREHVLTPIHHRQEPADARQPSLQPTP